MNRHLQAGLLAAALCASTAIPALADTSVLKIVKGTELRGLDPVFTTATYARDFGFLVYDQLFAIDADGKPQPEMVGDYTVSDDGMRYSFTLRDGLKFSDGSPVEAEDAVASILRWKEKDTVGKALFSAGAELEVVDASTFTLNLKEPFGLVLDALARPTANALFVMPKEQAQTPATEQIETAIGSGPFIFDAANWTAGSTAVFRKNPDYVPRDESPSGLAGGKVAMVDEIDWLSIPDANTAVSALLGGEIDYLEGVPVDLYPLIQADPSVELTYIDPNGRMFWIRPNTLNPPMDNPTVRQAVLHAIDQTKNMQAIGVPSDNYFPFCGAYFMCGTPLETEVGAEGLEKPDFEKSKALLKEAGYDGTPIIFMQPTDLATNSAVTQVLAEGMRKAGFNVDVQSMDWGTLSQRRNVKDTSGPGAWHLFVTSASTFDAGTPLTNLYLASPCPNNIAGFTCDEELEKLRRSWWQTGDADARKKIVDQIQLSAYQQLPYFNGGQWRQFAAIRKVVQGVRPVTVPVFWGVSKTE